MTQAGISGVAGNSAVRTGDAESGIAPILNPVRAQQNIDAQITITSNADLTVA